MGVSSKIVAPISEEMRGFEAYFKQQIKSEIPLLTVITNYLIRRKGRQMRPMLVFPSSRLNGDATEASYTGAALIELPHTATLIHDDAVDETYQGSGFFSTNALRRPQIAGLGGNYH